jgi:GDP-4-dehydro-6-deoxy-D-mannose reductase
MSNALITGAAGFFGFHLAKRLRGEGRLAVIGADRRSEPREPDLFTEYVSTDMADETKTTALIRNSKPQAIYHLAGACSGTDLMMLQTHVTATIHLLEAVRVYAPTAKILLVGSAAEYGGVEPERLPISEEQPCRPRGPYAISKYAMTMMALDYARRFGLKVVVVRPFNIVGAHVPANLVVGALLERIRQCVDHGSGPLRVGNLDTERDFIAVEDVVDGCLRLMQADCWGEVFNLCSGVPRSIRWMIQQIFLELGRSLPLEVDRSLVRSDDVQRSYGSWSKASAAVGFRPQPHIEPALRAASRAGAYA